MTKNILQLPKIATYYGKARLLSSKCVRISRSEFQTKDDKQQLLCMQNERYWPKAPKTTVMLSNIDSTNHNKTAQNSNNSETKTS